MHPIVILWAHPRSMSTAIERVMRERGDFDCLHEPFLHYYYLEKCGKPLPHFDSEQDHPTSYSETRDMILDRASRAPVFAKDMSYYVIPELLEDSEFCRQVSHCFLIRNPRYSIMSYYKLDQSISLDEVGIEAQWRHLEGLRTLGIDRLPVLEAEAVQRDAAFAMRRFWHALELDDCQQALNWDAESTPEDWQYVQGWHQQASTSRGILAASAGDDERARQKFEELVRQVPHLNQYLQHHLEYYDRLRRHSVTGNADET